MTDRTPTAPSRHERLARGTAWLVAALCVAVAGPLIVADRWSEGHHTDAVATPTLLVLPVLGALVAARRLENPVGWLFLASGASVTAGLVFDGGRLPLLDAESAAAAIGSQIAFSTGVPLLALALVLFPDGRPPSGRWRVLASVLATSIGLGAASAVIATWPEDLYSVRNPLAPSGVGDIAAILNWVAISVGLAAVPLSAIALVVRYTAAREFERIQLKWVLLPILIGGVALTTTVLADAFGDVPPAVEQVVLVPLVIGVPAGAAIGILRHRLFDIDLILNRVLIFGCVWIILLTAYVATVVAGTSVVTERVEWAPPLTAAVLVAVAFHPLRTWIQRVIDRRLFGARSDPYHALATIDRLVSGAAEVDDACKAIVAAVQSALRVPHVALELQDGIRAVAGTPGRTPHLEIPVQHGEDSVGVLRIGQRSSREHFTRSDHRLLQDLATQAAIAVRATAALAQVRESRRRIISAVEAERRRLRRDLHDGLGAALTGLTFSVRAAQASLDHPGRAGEILEKVESELRTAIDDIRRLVHDLRPPALDDLGLAAALEQRARRLCSAASIGLTFDASPTLPPLPPSTETAAYRIALEACTNVVRHARATHCWMQLHANQMLQIEVTDNGVGLPFYRVAGTGTATMHERAHEVGGELKMTANPEGGTIVRVLLPLHES